LATELDDVARERGRGRRGGDREKAHQPSHEEQDRVNRSRRRVTDDEEHKPKPEEHDHEGDDGEESVHGLVPFPHLLYTRLTARWAGLGWFPILRKIQVSRPAILAGLDGGLFARELGCFGC
jgi:hypothetical protein